MSKSMAELAEELHLAAETVWAAPDTVHETLLTVAKALREFEVRISIEISGENYPAVQIGTYPSLSVPIAFTTLDHDRKGFDHELEPSMVAGGDVKSASEMLFELYQECLKSEDEGKNDDGE